MRLNLYIIEKELKDVIHYGEILHRPGDFPLSSVQFCREIPEMVREDILYILSEEVVPEGKAKFSCSSSFLSAQRMPDDWECSSLLYRPETDSLTVLNRVLEMFARYREWESDVSELFFCNRPWMEFARRSDAFLPHPLILHDGAFKVFLRYTPQHLDMQSAACREYQENYGSAKDMYITEDEINYILSDPAFQQPKENTPLTVDWSNYDFRSMMIDLVEKDHLEARIIFDELPEPFSRYDEAILMLLKDMVKKGIQYKDKNDLNRPSGFREILESLLAHRLVPETKIQTLLNNYGWKISDTYFCMILNPRYDNRNKESLRAISARLNWSFVSAFSILYQEQLIVVLNTTCSGGDREKLLSMILPLLRDGLINAGISSEFQDFKNLYSYYKQAKFAFETGSRLHPEQWHHRFEDYLLQFIVSSCTEKRLPDMFYPAGLLRLIRYDEVHGTELVRFLQVYLEQNCSIAESVRILYLHRNTFLYRLEKVRAILGTDLKNPDERFCMLAALKIYETCRNDR